MWQHIETIIFMLNAAKGRDDIVGFKGSFVDVTGDVLSWVLSLGFLGQYIYK
jgi:hypothetical protein